MLYSKFGEIWHVVFEIYEWTDKQTNRCKVMLITILPTPTGGEGQSKIECRFYFYSSYILVNLRNICPSSACDLLCLDIPVWAWHARICIHHTSSRLGHGALSSRKNNKLIAAVITYLLFVMKISWWHNSYRNSTMLTAHTFRMLEQLVQFWHFDVVCSCYKISL